MKDPHGPNDRGRSGLSPAAGAVAIAVALVVFSATLTWNTLMGLEQLRRRDAPETLTAITLGAGDEKIASASSVWRQIAAEGPSEIAFGSESLGAALLSTGWLGPEEWGVWSGEGQAALSLPTSIAGASVTSLKIDFVAFAPPGFSQELVFTVDGVELDRTVVAPVEGTLIPAGAITLQLPSEASDAPKRQLLVLEIGISNPISPEDAGVGPDSRRLGIGLSRITLNPGAASPPT